MQGDLWASVHANKQILSHPCTCNDNHTLQVDNFTLHEVTTASVHIYCNSSWLLWQQSVTSRLTAAKSQGDPWPWLQHYHFFTALLNPQILYPSLFSASVFLVFVLFLSTVLASPPWSWLPFLPNCMFTICCCLEGCSTWPGLIMFSQSVVYHAKHSLRVFQASTENRIASN